MDPNYHPRHHTRRPPTPPRQSAAHAHRPPPNGHGYAASSDPHHAPYDASGFIDTDEDEETEHELVHPHPSHGHPPNRPAYNDDDDEGAEGEEEGEEEVGPEELEEEEEADELSDSSSADYDPHADPAEFAKRLDELAGVREVGVREERAVKGGPVLGLLPGEKRGLAPTLPPDQFKRYIMRLLDSTAWQYPSHPFDDPPTHAYSGIADEQDAARAKPHPIRVHGRQATGVEVGETFRARRLVHRDPDEEMGESDAESEEDLGRLRHEVLGGLGLG